jgi:galactose mutarotase-like enzyme
MAETLQMDDWLTLENEYVELTLAPQFGARVTSLIDKRTGRDWLVQGDLVGRQDNEAPFLGPQAYGWDECYPTVGRCMSIAWRRTLRDHGDLWGRSWQCARTPDGISATYTDDQIRFTRTLALEGTSIVAAYKATNANETLMPTLWSQHCLLACLPGERLTLEGITDIRADGQPIDLTNVDGTDFTTVHDLDSRLALKAYGSLTDQARISIAGDKGGIAFSWNAEDAAYVGLWLDYGGWPEDAPVHQVAIEPTTSPTDDLAGALAGEHAIWLKPVQSRSWTSTITLLASQ